MNSNFLYVFFTIAFTTLLLSNCGEKSSNTKPSYTMAVDSELTLLMRDMYNYFDGIKADIENGEKVESIKTFQEIHKAVATTPEKSSNELFQGMASLYVKSANRLNNPKANQKDAFNQMVDNCMSCHQQMCPGPMVKIKKLYLD